jgi:hypothetical protein
MRGGEVTDAHPLFDFFLLSGTIASPKAFHFKQNNMERCINHEEAPWGSLMS